MQIRPMVAGDLDAVMAVERLSWQEPMEVGELCGLLNSGHAQCRVAVASHRYLHGFVLYRRSTKCLWLNSVSVLPSSRRSKVGTLLVRDLLNTHAKAKAVVHEQLVVAQLFLRSLGFRWVQTRRRFFGDMDAYLMECNGNS